MIPAPKNVSESFVRNNYGAIDLDKYDWFADCEPQDTPVDAADLVDDDDPAELARMAADWAANAPASAGRNPFLR